MPRTRLTKLISITLPVLLTAGVVVASARAVTRSQAGSGEQPESAFVGGAKTPYELRFMTAAADDGNPFNVTRGGPGAPGYPQLPSETKRVIASVPSSITAANWQATQTPGDVASYSWALIVGINDYAGGVRDNIGSYQDAVTLRAYLLALGWRNDHIVLIGNRSATKKNILEGLQWLQSKTDGQSTVVFHYSGHEKPCHHDPRGEICLWASDSGLIGGHTMSAQLGRVRYHKMWINFAVCRATGFDGPGTTMPGRVVTFSSPQYELSYEDPKVHHSVLGEYEIVQGLVERKADNDGNGIVGVEEAFDYARPLVLNRTENNQHPIIHDEYPGDFYLSPTAA